MKGKKRKSERAEGEVAGAVDVTSEDSPSRKKAKVFSMEHFQERMKNNAVAVLTELWSACRASGDGGVEVVREFLSGGGQPQQIVALLHTASDDHKATLVFPVFCTLKHLLLCHAALGREHQEAVESACRQLLTSHMAVVHKALASTANAETCITTLNMLSVMVMQSESLAKLILGGINLTPRLVASLARQTSPTTTTTRATVRTHFLRFMMAFLVADYTEVIQLICHKRGLLGQVLANLVTDAPDTVLLVLNALRKKLLENPLISDRTKAAVFDPLAVHSLLGLYRWVGPDPVEKVYEERRDEVAQAAHGLMLRLCMLSGRVIASTFPQRKGSSSNKKLHLLGKIIMQELKEPWHDELQCQLVQKTLATCPHLLKTFLPRLDGLLLPSNSLRWHHTVDLYTRVLESLHPETCAPLQKQVVMDELVTLTAPSSVLMATVSGDSLLQDRLSIRHQIALLLRAVLYSTDRLLSSVEARKLLREHEQARLRADFVTHLLQYLPTGEVLVSTWKKAVAGPGDDEQLGGADVVAPPSLQEHLSLLLDVLAAYGRCCPHVLSCDTLQPLSLLTDIQAHCPGLVHKALSVLFLLDPSGFTPDKELFKTSVTLLLAVVADQPCPETSLTVLVDLLQLTGLFVAEPSEPLVWLHCYLDVPPASRPTVANLLASALVLVATNPRHYADVLSFASNAQRPCCSLVDSSLFKILHDLLTDKSSGKSVDGMATAGLSPLLPVVLQLAADADKAVAAFVSRVVVHVLHGQVSPDLVAHMLKKQPCPVLQVICDYVQGWLPSGSPKSLPKPFPRNSLERKLSRLMLRPSKLTVEEVFGDLLSNETPVVINKLPVRDAFHVLLLLRLLSFHVGQLLARNCIVEKSCGDYQQAVSCLLKSIRALLPMRSTYPGLGKFVESYLRSMLQHPAVLSAFAPGSSMGGLMAGLVKGVVTSAGEMLPRDALLPLRKQLMINITVSLEGKPGCLGQNLLPGLKLLGLCLKDLVHLVELAAAVPTEVLVDDGTRLSPHGTMLSSLLRNLSAKAGHHCSVVLECTVEKLVQHLTSLSGRNITNLSKLQRAFHSFLIKYPHHLIFIPEGVLRSLLVNDSRSTHTVKLCLYLVKSEERFAREFVRLAEEHEVLLEDTNCVFGLLSASLLHGPDTIPTSLLQKVFEQHKDLLHKAVLRHRNSTSAWLTRSTSVVSTIMQTLMDVDECTQLCRQVKKSGVVNGKTHLQLLQSLFMRAVHLGEEHALAWWCSVLFRAANMACQHWSGTTKWLERLCSSLRSCVEEAGSSPVLGRMERDRRWWEFATQALAAGLGQVPCMLDALAHLCGAVYQDGLDHEQPIKLFNMLVAHSQFLPVMFDNTRPAKRSVLELLLVLTRKAPCVMSATLAATLLESYGASLSITDQLILKLLHQCEQGGVSLQKWRPYLWGQAAVNQHNRHAQLSTVLLQEPSVGQVLDLLSPDVVGNTINYFPMDRQLCVEGQMCRNQPKVYDPAFFLPLLSHLLSPENPLSVGKVPKSGALALCIAALSSDHELVRRAACHALARYYLLLEASRQHAEKQVWMQLVDCLREGVGLGGPEFPQLPSIITVYLAHVSLHMCRPTSTLFTPLLNYLCLWPAFNVHAVPDFLRLFHSPDVEHREHQRFILEVLRAGIRREADFDLAHKSVIYKMLMSFYSSVLSDQISKVLILRVLQSSVKVPTAAALLVSSYGLLSWLSGVVKGLDRAQAGAVLAVLHLLCDLWETLGAQMNPAAASHIVVLLLALLPKLSSKLHPRNLRRYLEALGGMAAAARLSGAMSTHDVTTLLRFCEGIIGPVEEYEFMLMFGNKYTPWKVQKVKSGELWQCRQCLHSFMLSWLEQSSHSS